MNIKKLLHGALALALTFALIVSSLVFASAVTVTDEASLEAALATGGEIIINNDIEYSKRIKLDSSQNITFKGTGSVTFTSSTQSSSEFHIYGGCKVVFDGPSFKVSTASHRILVISKEGINGSTNGEIQVTINAGTFMGEIQPQGECNLFINGGTFKQHGGGMNLLYPKNSTSKTVINGGTFIPSDDGQTALICNNNGSLIINGGTFTQPSASNLITSTKDNSSTTPITINGGTFIGTNSDNTLVWSYGALTINGGKFTAFSTSSGNVVSGTTANISIKGGSFNKTPNAGSLVSYTTGSDGYLNYGTHVKYSDELDTAISNGGTIYIDSSFSYSGSSIALSDKNINFQGTGTVTCSGDGPVLTNTSNIVIDGPTFKATTSGKRGVVIWNSNCVINSGGITGIVDLQGANSFTTPSNLVINGGTFTQSGNNNSSNGNLLRVGKDSNDYSTTVINGGTFTGAGTVDMLTGNSAGTLIINGGTFDKASGQTAASVEGYFLINDGNFNFDPNPFATFPVGHEANEGDNGYWTVGVIQKRTVTTFAELQQAITDNVPEIIINTDIEATDRLLGGTNKNITFTGTGSVIFTGTTKATSEFHIYGGCNIIFDGPSFIIGNANKEGRLLVIADDNDTTPISVVINAGTFKGEIQAQAQANLTINGGTFNTKDNQTDKYICGAVEAKSYSSTKLTINGGTFNSTGRGHCVNVGAAAQATIKGGTYNVTGSGYDSNIDFGYAFFIQGTVNTLKDVTVNTSGDGKLIYVASGKTVSLQNVTLNSTSTASFLSNAVGVLEITSGTYNHVDGAKFANVSATKNNVNFTGGTYNFDPAWMLKGEYVSKYIGNDTYTIRLGQKVVTSLDEIQAAIDANYSEIRIDDDISGSITQLVCTGDKDITFTGDGSVTIDSSKNIAFAITVGANVVFNGPSFAVGNNSSRLIVIYNESTDVLTDVTINDGTFTGEIQSQEDAELTVNGGIFNANADCGSYPNALVVKSHPDASLYINGGIINISGSGSGIRIENGTANINGGTINHTGTGNAVYFSNSNSANITLRGITVDSTATGGNIFKIDNIKTDQTLTLKNVNVTVASAALKTGTGALKIVSGTYNNIDPTEYVNSNNSTITESNGNYIVTAIDKMLRFTNGYNSSFNYYAITNYATLATGKTYELSIDYRAFGGAGGLRIDPELKTNASNGNGYNNKHITTLSEELAGINAQVIKDNGTNYTLRFTVTEEIATSGTNFRIRLGQLEVQTGATNSSGADISTKNYSTSLYIGNVSVCEVINGKSSGNNLIANGEFDDGTLGAMTVDDAATYIPSWSDYNFTNFTSVDLMKTPENFFTVEDVADLIDLTDDKEDYAVRLDGGDRHELQFKVNLKPNTTYKFSYYVRANGDLPEFIVATDFNGLTVKELVSESLGEYLKKTYVISLGTLPNGKGTRNRFRFAFGHNSDDATAYITKVQLFELDANGDVNSLNLIGDYNPVFTDYYTSDFVKAQMGQDDNAIMTNIIAHGWLGLFNKYSDIDPEEGEYDVNIGSDDYAGVAKVDSTFFKNLGDGADVRNGIFGKVAYDSAYDIYLDGKYDVLDVLIAKMEAKGYYGADFQVEILKNEILNAGDTTPTDNSKVYYVSPNGSDTNTGTKVSPFKTLAKALNKATSGYTILLERGGQWYMPSNDDDVAWEITKNNITIGAYTGNLGTAKPLLIGSVKNYAESSWSNQGNNIWKITLDNNGGANIPGAVYFFDKAEATQPTLVGTIINGNNDNGGTAFTSTSQLAKEGDVYRDYDAQSSWLGNLWGGTKNNVYIYCEGNPNKYDRIYITESSDAFYAKGKENITIDNLCIKYVGAHGINFKGCENITVTNCEIGYIGGAPSSTTLGNGIQFGMKGNNLIADHNYVYQCYDAGITPQSWENDGDFRTNLNLTNVKITNNLLTNNFDNIEFWNSNGGKMEMEISGNILKDAADCWSYDQRPDGGNIRRFGCHVYGGRNAYNANMQITVNDNIFDTTKVNVFCWFWGGKDNAAELPQRFGEGSATGYMTFSSNIYYQEAGAYDAGQVMLYGNVGDQDVTKATSQQGFETAIEQLDISNDKFVRWVVTRK